MRLWKITAMMLIIMMISPQLAWAAEVEVTLNTAINQAVIDITAQPYSEVSIMVLKPDVTSSDIPEQSGSLNNFAIFVDTLVTDGEGRIIAVTEIPDVPGYYTFSVVSALDQNQKSVYIGTVAAIETALKEIIDAPEGDIKRLLQEHRELLNLKNDTYDMLLAANAELTIVYKAIAQLNITPSETSKLLETLSFASDIAYIGYTNDSNIIGQLLEKNKGKLLEPVFISALDEVFDELVLELSKSGEVSEIEQFIAQIKDFIMLSKANNIINVGQLDSFVEDFHEMLGIDFAQYNSLGVRKEIAFKEFVKKLPYKTVDQAATAINSAITVAQVPINTSSPVGGVSGGGGGGGVSYEVGTRTQATPAPTPTLTENQSQEKQVAPFEDIEQVEWAKSAIYELQSRGVINGVADGRFDGMANVKREQLTKMLVEALGLKSNAPWHGFGDIGQTDWCSEYIAIAKENGIVNGISSDEFGVGLDITRQDMAVMIAKSLKLKGFHLDAPIAGFFDIDQVDDYAKESVSALVALNIINGVGDNLFAPKQSATRAQAAKIIYEMLILIERGQTDA